MQTVLYTLEIKGELILNVSYYVCCSNKHCNHLKKIGFAGVTFIDLPDIISEFTPRITVRGRLGATRMLDEKRNFRLGKEDIILYNAW